jgi:hypothetical protein
LFPGRWYEENKIIKQICLASSTFRFQEHFFLERFLPYDYIPLEDFAQLETLMGSVEYIR